MYVHASSKISTFLFLLNCNININQVVIDFTVSWCPPCKFIAPLFNEMAAMFTDAEFIKIDVDELSVIFTFIFSLFLHSLQLILLLSVNDNSKKKIKNYGFMGIGCGEGV